MVSYVFPFPFFSSLFTLETGRKWYFVLLKWSSFYLLGFIHRNSMPVPQQNECQNSRGFSLTYRFRSFEPISCQKLFFFFSRPHCKSFLSVPLLCLAVSLSHTQLVSNNFLISSFFTKSSKKKMQLNGLTHGPNFCVDNGFLSFTKRAFNFSLIYYK